MTELLPKRKQKLGNIFIRLRPEDCYLKAPLPHDSKSVTRSVATN